MSFSSYKLMQRCADMFYPMMAVFVLLLTQSNEGFAISNPADSVPHRYAIAAATYCQQHEFDKAKIEIESAIQSPLEANEVYTWYIRGFLYKEIYKNNEATDKYAPSRDIAIESFLKAKSMNEQNERDNNNDAALRYLASTYYNDAVSIANAFVKDDDEQGDLLFQKYTEVMKALDQSANLHLSKTNFLKAKAQRYTTLWLQDVCNSTFMNQALNITAEVISSSPEDCLSKYNEAVIHYYIGIKSSEAIATCFTSKEQVEHLNIAKKLLQDAEITCTSNVDVINALLNISRFENDEELIKEYELKLNQILGGVNRSK